MLMMAIDGIAKGPLDSFQIVSDTGSGLPQRQLPPRDPEMPQIKIAALISDHNSNFEQFSSSRRLPPKLKRQVPPESISCSICSCSTELDIKPSLSGGVVSDNDFTAAETAGWGQVSLDTLCSLGGQGDGGHIMKENLDMLDKDTCNICPTCFGIVESARELKEHIELLKSDLVHYVGMLKSNIENSLQSPGQKKVGRPRRDVAKFRQIQNVLLTAFGPELLPNPAASLAEPCNKRVKVELDGEIAAGGYQNGNQIKTESVENSLPSTFDFNGHKIFTVPIIKSEFGTINNGTNTVAHAANKVTAAPCRQKRKYVKKMSRTKVKDENDGEGVDDWRPQEQEGQRQKRKYVRRKPLKRECTTITFNDEDNESDGDEVFVIPIIQSVKTESTNTAKGCAALLNCGDGKWLTDNVEVAENGVILRSTLYHHYFAYCLQNGRKPPNQAAFGKLVKFMFQGIIKSRRLGSRGGSMYCHTGVRIKADSPLYTAVEEYDIEENPSPDKPKQKSKRGVLTELGIRVPPRPRNNIVNTSLFGTFSLTGCPTQTQVQSFQPLLLNMDSSLLCHNSPNDLPPDDILRNLLFVS